MANEPNLHIIIVGETTPKARMILSLVKQIMDKDDHVDIVKEPDLTLYDSTEKQYLCILDLISSSDPSVKVIRRVKDQLPFSKLLGLHIYKSPLLIQPMLDCGLDGYLSGDPARKELTNAIKNIMDGKFELPGTTSDK
jgi:DNA-binding NarL/FixJ family response regulator